MLVCGFVAVVGCGIAPQDGAAGDETLGQVTSAVCTVPSFAELSANLEHYTSPDRDVIKDAAGNWLATFTDGARTARIKDLNGSRTITDNDPNGDGSSSDAISFSTNQRVFIWDEEYDGTFSQTEEYAWLQNELCASQNDIITRAAQYFNGATVANGSDGLGPLYGDACYGKSNTVSSNDCLSVSTNTAGADFYDYRGMSWGSPALAPDANFIRSLDCSGYVRMLFGWRGTGSPTRKLDLGRTDASGMTSGSSPCGEFVPRSSGQMHSTTTTQGVRYTWGTDNTKLDPGDLVFYDVSADTSKKCDGTAGSVDHVGIVLYNDRSGTVWVASSRAQGSTTRDGPLLHALNYATTVGEARRW